MLASILLWLSDYIINIDIILVSPEIIRYRQISLKLVIVLLSRKSKRYCSMHPVVFVTFTILLFFKGKKMLLVRCITDDIIDILCVILIKGCKHTQMRWKERNYEIA